MIPNVDNYEHEHSWVLDHDGAIRCSSCGEEDEDVNFESICIFAEECKECGDKVKTTQSVMLCLACQEDFGMHEIILEEHDDDRT